MTHLKISGVVGNIRKQTSVYTPIIEAIVNSIQAIDDSGRNDGEIVITVKRIEQGELDFDGDALPDIGSLEIQDNGVGFNSSNRNSFDTLYSDLKAKIGGKGFGRFMFLKYFDAVRVESVFNEKKKYQHRSFTFGKNEDIIEHEELVASDEKDTKTILYLDDLQEGKLDKKLDTLARKLLQKLLIYFINDDYKCPRITVKEEVGGIEIVLNEYLTKDEHAEIQQVDCQTFVLDNKKETEEFQVKIFKIYFPHSQRSKISLTAHNREVKETPLHQYVPEFEDDFYEDFEGENVGRKRKDYMIVAYVLGRYLDAHVSCGREDFDFSTEKDLFFPFSQQDIETKTAKIVKEIFADEVKTRKNKKKERIVEYVQDAPWHKEYVDDLDIDSIPYNVSDEDIELLLHKAKFQQEVEVREQAREIIDSPEEQIDASIQELVNKISKAEMSNLARYVALRKTVLGLFRKSLEMNTEGKYTSENAVHSIIFPTRADSESVPYDKHNLWIIDEKLNFTRFISSDQPLDGGTTKRPDLLVYDRQMAFRADNQASNPITIFEFKKPQRDDFTNPSAPKKEDPIYQITQYANNIKDGKFKTPEGRDISVGSNTPFYGFVVCDLTWKVREWLLKEKQFKEMPDGEGWFKWFENSNLYIEVISWDKMLKDAEMRNKIFFEKLGL